MFWCNNQPTQFRSRFFDIYCVENPHSRNQEIVIFLLAIISEKRHFCDHLEESLNTQSNWAGKVRTQEAEIFSMELDLSLSFKYLMRYTWFMQ